MGCLLEFRLTPVMQLALTSNRALDENPETTRTRRMAQLAQRFGFNLANTLAGYVEYLANFFQSVFAAVVQTETHFDDSFFAGRKRAQHGRHLFLQIQMNCSVRGR